MEEDYYKESTSFVNNFYSNASRKILPKLHFVLYNISIIKSDTLQNFRISRIIPGRFLGTFSQPSIRCSSQSPQPGTSRAAAAEEEIQVEDEDVYGESLPELSYSHRIIQHRRSRAQSRSLDDPTAGTGVSSSRGSSTGREISISMGEVGF